MLRRVIAWSLSRHVLIDADRLVRSYESEAIFMARHAALVNRLGRIRHWSRVLAEVERTVRYRPW